MKAGKFAPITSALLARKGEARPWTNEQNQETVIGFFPHRAPAFGHAVKDQANDSSPFPLPPTSVSHGPDGVRKLTLRVSQTDYERLGLIAAKRDITRQHLLHDMLERFFAEAAEEYGGGCGCIGGSCQRQD